MSGRISTKEYSDLILQKVQEVMDEDRFKTFLKAPDMLQAFRGEVLGLEPYSFNNRLTLALFGARAVAGFKTWLGLGYAVKKGSKGIPIYRPIIVKQDKAQEEQLAELDENERHLVGFSVTYVFDVSQVAERDGEEHAEARARVKGFFTKQDHGLCRELSGGEEAMAESIKAWIDGQTPVRFEALSNMKGYTNGKEIVVKKDMSSAQTIKTLLHELAHCRLKHMESTLTRNAKEIQAESAAFVAANQMGLDTGPYSFDYLAAWGNEVLESDKGIETFRSILQEAIDLGQLMAVEYKTYTERLVPMLLPVVTGWEARALEVNAA